MPALFEYAGHRAAGYLDTAAYGLPPDSTLAALERALAGWGAGEQWRQWEEEGEMCRSLFASLLGARVEEVALMHAVSAAAGLVAASLPVQPGDNVVLYERDYTSTLLPWQGLERRGVELRLRPLDKLASSVDERTVLVALSAVQSATGVQADLRALKQTDARVFVDASQAVGAVPFSLEGLDYVAVHTYKWLCAPRGLTCLWVRPEHLEEIEPWTAGWKSRDRPYDDYYGIPQLTPHARRLDVSLAWLSAAGARTSLELVTKLGLQAIVEHDLGLARSFCSQAGLSEPSVPIVRLEVAAADEVLAALARAGIRAAGRDGAVRLSFHFYNDEQDVDRSLEVLASEA